MRPPIYKPSGRALEYSPDALALNIYTGCPHRCYYCFAPSALHKDREAFHSHVEARPGIVDAVKRQLDSGYATYTETVTHDGEKHTETRRIPLGGKLIHLCFTCDPYPRGYDTSATREIIKAIKDAGNHVQILTKNAPHDPLRDFDLLDGNDWFGITYTGTNHSGGGEISHSIDLFWMLRQAHDAGIKTWVSCEPVLRTEGLYNFIEAGDFIDLFRIGRLNYHPSDINWGDFGREAERLCKLHGRQYYIKDDLRKAMEG
jgi:DNA repair photolyase